MAKNNGLIIPLGSGGSLTRDVITVFRNTSEDHFQIAFKVKDSDGDVILPENLIAGDVSVKIRPVGQGGFVEADHVIDLTNNEFFRPFQIRPEAIQFDLDNLDPADATVEATVFVVTP